MRIAETVILLEEDLDAGWTGEMSTRLGCDLNEAPGKYVTNRYRLADTLNSKGNRGNSCVNDRRTLGWTDEKIPNDLSLIIEEDIETLT